MGKAYTKYVKQREKERSAEMRKKNGGPLFRFILYLAGFAVVISSLISFISSQAEIAEKKQELAELNAKAAELEIINEEYSSILSEEDERIYMERLAIDILGYAYPNERRFYDTTRN